VSGTPPAKVDCPFCNGTLTVYSGPDKGPWLYCSSCFFAGDAIQFAHKHFNTNSIRDAIDSIIQYGVKFAKAINDQIIEEYLLILEEREKINGFWNTAKTFDPNELVPAFNELIRKYHLSTYRHSLNWFETVGRWIGLSTAGQIKELLPVDITPSKSEIGEHNTHFMLIPYYILPGYICGFKLFSLSGEAYKTVGQAGPTGLRESGLFGMDTITPGNISVYCSFNPIYALYIQGRHMYAHNATIPMVSWEKNTSFSWANVFSKRVVLWVEKLDINVFKHASRIQNAFITMHPYTESPSATLDEWHWKIGQKTPEEILTNMQNNAVPWVHALKKYLLKNPTKAVDTIDRLNLSLSVREGLLNACKAPEKRILRKYFDTSLTGGEVFISQKDTVVEKDDGYWRISSHKHTKVSNIKIVVNKVLRFARSDQTRFQGKLYIEDHEIEFNEDKNVIFKDEFNWVEKTVLNADVGVLPLVSSPFRSKLFEIAMQMHPPDVERVMEYIGWDKYTDKYVFPSFRVNNGVIIREPSIVLPEYKKLPYTNVRKDFKSRGINVYLEVRDSDVHMTFWCFFTSLIRNIMAERMGWSVLPTVFVVDDKTSNPPSVILNFMKSIGIPKVDITSFEKLDIVKDVNSKSSIPVYAKIPRARGDILLNLIESEKKINMITCMSNLMYRVSALYPGFFYIPESNCFNRKDSGEHTNHLIPYYLEWIQKNNYKYFNNNRKSVNESILDSIYDWEVERFAAARSADFDKVIDRAKKHIKCFEDSPRYLAYRIIELIGFMRNHNLLETGTITVNRHVVDLNYSKFSKRVQELSKLKFLDFGLFLAALDSLDMVVESSRSKTVLKTQKLLQCRKNYG
jgi:hypothetical protein